MALPHLVLLPGMDGTGDNFRPLLDTLGDHQTTTVAYPSDRPLELPELLDHVRTRLPTVPYVLVAESFSGPLGLHLAAEVPPGLVGLVLVASFARLPLPLPAGFVRIAAPALFWGRPPSLALRLALAGSGAPQAVVDRLRRSILRNGPGVMASRLRLLTRLNATSALSRITVPTLALSARRDRLVPPRALDALRRELADLTVVELDTAHLVLQRAPREALDALERWWALTGPPGAASRPRT